MIINRRAIDRGEKSRLAQKNCESVEPRKRKVRETRHQGLVGNNEESMRKNE